MSQIAVAEELVKKAEETITKAVNAKKPTDTKKLTQQGLSELQIGNERKRKFQNSLQELIQKKMGRRC